MKSLTEFLKDPFGKKARESEAKATAEELTAGLKGFLAAMESKKTSITPITEADISGGFRPIEGLRPAMKVKWRGPEFKTDKWPELGQIVAVHSVDVPVAANEPGKAIERPDFTVLFRRADGEIQEFAFDSRRFEEAVEF